MLARTRSAVRPALWHFFCSLLMAASVAVFVFIFWFPPPFQEIAGGRDLFFLIVWVDVVCGPLLTLVLFNPKKSRKEFYLDMSLVVGIQIAALFYGIYAVNYARPLYLVHDVDRFRVVALPDLKENNTAALLKAVNQALQPSWFKGPVVVGIRESKTEQERKEVLLEAITGGADYYQRPEFYVPFDDEYRKKVLINAKPLSAFVNHYPQNSGDVLQILQKHDKKMKIEGALYLPVVFKEEWIAILDGSARIIGYMPGEGFLDK